MIFHENRLLADDSHVISNLIFVENWESWGKILSAAVVFGALRVKNKLFNKLFHGTIRVSNGFYLDQDRHQS